jgi:hypothetical protein
VDDNADKGPVLMDSTLGDAVPDMPEVQDHAIAAARERLSAEAPARDVKVGEPSAVPVKGKTDIKGRAYDPAIHESPMRINRDGWIACKRGRVDVSTKPATPSRSKIVPPTQGKPAAPVSAVAIDPAIEAQASAEMCAGLFFTGAMFVGGEEFKPDDKAEQDFIVGSMKNYFIAKGCPDIPPGVALAGALGFFIAKRWTRPKFTEKRQGWWAWVKSTVKSFRENRNRVA